jgi:pimeloyl-ACP methyl ester carboxylesterase
MRTIVMVPAMGCDQSLYREVVGRLSPYITVSTILADRDVLVDCISHVLDQAPEKFIVLGTSFGGRVALETALAAPQRVQGLVVIGAGAGVAADPAAGFKRAERLRGAEFELVVAEMAEMVSHLAGSRGPATRDAFIRMANTQGGTFMARQSDALAKRLDLWPRLGEIKCPSLMLWGKHDQFSPAADGLKMSMGIERARYVELPDSGHFPSLEAPEETADILLHWLRDAKLI